MASVSGWIVGMSNINTQEESTEIDVYESDDCLNTIWAVEVENRLNAYRAGKLEGIPMEEVFKDEL